MRLREHPGIGEGRTDILPCDPRQLSLMENYNVRDLTTPEAREELDELKAKVKAHGVRTPLVVKFDGANIFIVEGHKRHKVAMELIAEHEASGGSEGRNIDFVPITAEKLGTNDIDRDYGLETSNSGSRLKPLELANLIYRLHTQRGQSLESIADGLSKSLVVIKNHLAMRAMPEEVKEHVREGDISATEAAKLVKNLPKGTDPKLAADLIAKNKEENKRLGVGKRTKNKVTAKTLNRDKPKPALKSDPQKSEPEKAEIPAPIMAPNAEVEPPPATKPEPMFRDADEVKSEIARLDVALAEKHKLPPEAFQPPASTLAFRKSRPNNRIDELLLDFISVDAPELATMYRRLVGEREQAAGEGNSTDAQEQLCVAADVIGALRFPDQWEQAKGNSELAEVA